MPRRCTQPAQAEKGALLAELEAARGAVAEAEAAKSAACACADTSRSQLAQLETRLLDAQCAAFLEHLKAHLPTLCRSLHTSFSQVAWRSMFQHFASATQLQCSLIGSSGLGRHAFSDAEAGSAAAREAAEAAAAEQARLQGELAAVRAQLEAAAGPPEDAERGSGHRDARTARLLEQLQARARRL